MTQMDPLQAQAAPIYKQTPVWAGLAFLVVAAAAGIIATLALTGNFSSFVQALKIEGAIGFAVGGGVSGFASLLCFALAHCRRPREVEQAPPLVQPIPVDVVPIPPVDVVPIPVDVPPKDPFEEVNSSLLIMTNKPHKGRFDFWRDKEWQTAPPIIGHSDFVSPRWVDFLMRAKKDSAIGVKYQQGKRDRISNMAGALHTFVTPVCVAHMAGDNDYRGHHKISPFGPREVRPVIMSAAIQPDFDRREDERRVMVEVLELRKTEMPGKKLSPDWQIDVSSEQLADPTFRKQYDDALRDHMIYYLTAGHKLPSLEDASLITADFIAHQLEVWIEKKDFHPSILVNKGVDAFGGHILSLEAFFYTYLHQLRNEFAVLEKRLPQGYVYTNNPPSFFLGAIGGTQAQPFVNRLQLLAFRWFLKENKLNNLKVIGFSDYCDKGIVALYQKVIDEAALPVEVCSTNQLYDQKTHFYVAKEKYALVKHNNSDGFGQNIETEGGGGSLDAILGQYSDASLALRRDRPDLTKHLVATKSLESL